MKPKTTKLISGIISHVLLVALCFSSISPELRAQNRNAIQASSGNPVPSKKGILMSERGQTEKITEPDVSENKQKIDPDLKTRVSRSAPNSSVSVIVQPKGEWSKGLDSDLKTRGAAQKKAYRHFEFRTIQIKAKDVESLAMRSDIDYISLDHRVKQLGHLSRTTGADNVRTIIDADNLLDGTGVGIAVLDSGIDANHSSFKMNGVSRIVYSQDFTGENRTDDPYGHGSHVASLAAGSRISTQTGSYDGIARNARIINLRVLDSQGTGTVSSLLSAIDWIMTNRTNPAYNIRVVNMSLGTAAIESYSVSPLCQAVRGLVNAGVVVAAAAGNEGKDSQGRKLYGLIHSPGNEPSAITVGASNSMGTNSRQDDTMTTFSSRGPTRSFWTDTDNVKHYDNLVKPDLVAPGNKIIGAQSPYNHIISQHPELNVAGISGITNKRMYLSGSSMSTPIVAGTAALMFQANPTLTPNMVKTLMMYSAQTLTGSNHFEQGAGEINIDGSVRLARLVRQDLTVNTPVGAPLLTANAPVPSSTINNFNFTWGQGLVMDHTFATGGDLINKYQKIYGLGFLLGDGTIESDGIIMGDGTLMSDGIIMGDGTLMTDGTLMSDVTLQAQRSMRAGDPTPVMEPEEVE